MKFLAILCLLALAAADEDKTTDKKSQVEATQNASSPTQPTATLLGGQVFPPASFSNVFATSDPVSSLAYTGFNGNVSPIQGVSPDFFAAPASGAISSYPVTRTVLPGTSAVVNGLQSAFPVAGNVFPAVAAIPAAVSAVQTQFSPVGPGILSSVSGIPTGALDPTGNAAANGPISPVSGTPYRFLTAEALSGIPTQGLQQAQQVGLAAIPAFTSGILPSLANGVLQAQNIPSGIQQVLKNPNVNPTGVPTVQGLSTGNLSSGPLTNVFRHA